MITKENENNNNNNEYVLLHSLDTHVRHVKQLQSISLKFFMLFLNSYTDPLDFM